MNIKNLVELMKTVISSVCGGGRSERVDLDLPQADRQALDEIMGMHKARNTQHATRDEDDLQLAH